jgi:hypothetical protein
MSLALANASAPADVSVCDIARGVSRDDLGWSRSNYREARPRGMADRIIHFVARVLCNAGAPEGEIDDDVQRTFIAGGTARVAAATGPDGLSDPCVGARKASQAKVAA